MQANYEGETYFDTNGAASYMGVTRETFRKRRRLTRVDTETGDTVLVINPSKLPGFWRDFFKKTELDNFPVVKRIETGK